MASTPGKDRQRELRARKAAAGLSEVRGIHAPAEDHAPIKEAALKHAARLTRARQRAKPPANP